MLSIIRFFVIGIVVGMANVIPGVSGGTLAVVFNVYDQFINAITFKIKKIWKNKAFVIPILCGMACGVLIFSELISFLYEHFPFQTNCVFTGLIIGSIPLLFSLMINGGEKKPEENTEAQTDAQPEEKEIEKKAMSIPEIISLVICVLAGFALILVFNHLENRFSDSSLVNVILPEISTGLLIRIFIAGFIGAVAMIVPGISGSLLMLMMGVYTIIITAIPALFSSDTMLHALFLLLPNGLGVILGLLCGAKAIRELLKRLPHQTYAVIFGLICGSIIVVFPGFSGFATIAGFISSLLCIAGGIAAAFFSSRIK